MPWTPEELRRFVALERLVGDLKKSLEDVAIRVEVAEKGAADLTRLATAAEDIAKAQHGPFGGKQ